MNQTNRCWVTGISPSIDWPWTASLASKILGEFKSGVDVRPGAGIIGNFDIGVCGLQRGTNLLPW